MGNTSNIHAYIEVKNDNKWRWQASVRIDPDEALFEFMAKNPKPMELLSSEMLDDIARYGAGDFSLRNHTRSWLTLAELDQIQDVELGGYYKNYDIMAVCHLMYALDKYIGDVRLVFWFDG